MRNIKIVQFHNGKYGIRRGWLFHEYRDLIHGYWWSLESKFIYDCMTTDYDLLCSMIHKPKVVNG